MNIPVRRNIHSVENISCMSFNGLYCVCIIIGTKDENDNVMDIIADINSEFGEVYRTYIQ